MQNATQKFRQSSLFSRNQVFCLKIWKLWQAPTILQFNIFCWNFTHVSDLSMSTKGCGIFFISVRSWVFAKIRKDLVSTQSCFTLLLITQDLNKIKNSHTRFCRHLELLKVFNFSAKKPGFLEIIKVCLNAGIRFFITWLLPNYKKIVRINQFWINHASHLK